MTILISNYNYMDLLKENGLVPNGINGEPSLMEALENHINNIIAFFNDVINDYDFISLVKEKSHYASRIIFASNDNDLLLQRA